MKAKMTVTTVAIAQSQLAIGEVAFYNIPNFINWGDSIPFRTERLSEVSFYTEYTPENQSPFGYRHTRRSPFCDWPVSNLVIPRGVKSESGQGAIEILVVLGLLALLAIIILAILPISVWQEAIQALVSALAGG